MLSIHNVGNGKEAGNYYEKADDYYTKDKSPSGWQGKAAEMLGLSGPVSIDDFRDLLDGNLPDGTQIQVAASGHRGGTDLTFSAPKSLSLQALIGGDDRLIEAHDNAVKRALNYAEGLIAYRHTRDGNTTRIKSGNMAAATFRHELSRACDPQVHTHSVILNCTRRPDGKWRAVDNEELYRQQMLMGALYRAELAREVQKIGYRIRRTRDDGLFELAHFTQEQLENFSSRSRLIEEHLAAKGKSRLEASATEKEIITLATRPRKTDVDRRILQEYWREKAAESGINFRIPGKGLKEECVQREAVTNHTLSFALDHCLERQAVVTKDRIFRTALEHGVGRCTFDEIDRELKKVVRFKKVIRRGDRFTTPKAQKREREILNFEKGGRGKVPPVLSVEHAFQGLKNLGLNPDQLNAACLILITKNQITGVQGLAGTGKTYMLKAARELAQKEDFKLLGLAPSAAATRELAKTGMASETLAAFELSSAEKLDGRTILIVDEAGMVSAKQMQSVLRISKQAGSRVVLVGDTQQLKAVEAGKPFAQLQANGMATAGMGEIQRQSNPQLKAAVELAAKGDIYKSVSIIEKEIVEIVGPVERYERIAKDFSALPPAERESTLILAGTNAARKAINDQVRKNLGLEEKGEPLKVLENRDLTKPERKQIEKYSVGDYVKPHRAYRSLSLKSGELCRVVKIKPSGITLEKPNGENVDWDPFRQHKFSVYRRQNREVAKGDLIRITENDRKLGLSNGDMAQVKKIHKDRVILEREDGKEFSLDRTKPLHVEHGYCSTVHSAQGRTCERVLIEADVKSLTSSKDTYYVALSRARRDAKIYTNDRKLLPEAMARENVKEAALEIHRKPEAGQVLRKKYRPERERESSFQL